MPRSRPPASGARGWIAALAAAWLAAPAPGAAQDSLEAPIKATFLYRFADFVTWPQPAFPSVGEALNICIVGDDVFGEVADAAFAGQTAAGRPLAVFRLSFLDADSACHIAYVAGSETQSVEDALAVARSAPMLTVTDEMNGPVRGAVHFELVDNRVRFHIDERAASESGLAISSRLLDIALSVQRRTP